mmetsp:Transcript_49229/g.107353  ORF Transcript_49229/g.107353 Transcript_49229/m.107353 type:complete len:263 (+) Transcript_49229:637-1425(+)
MRPYLQRGTVQRRVQTRLGRPRAAPAPRKTTLSPRATAPRVPEARLVLHLITRMQLAPTPRKLVTTPAITPRRPATTMVRPRQAQTRQSRTTAPLWCSAYSIGAPRSTTPPQATLRRCLSLLARLWAAAPPRATRAPIPALVATPRRPAPVASKAICTLMPQRWPTSPPRTPSRTAPTSPSGTRPPRQHTKRQPRKSPSPTRPVTSERRPTWPPEALTKRRSWLPTTSWRDLSRIRPRVWYTPRPRSRRAKPTSTRGSCPSL